MEEVEGNVPILKLEDPHAVIMAAGKGGVTYIAGKTMECGDHCAPPQRVASSSDAFAMKMDDTGLPVWGWKSNLAKKDAANGIAVLPSGDVLVGGYRYVNGIGVRSVTKLSGDSGKEDWTMTSFGDGVGQYAGAMDAESKQMFGMHGAIELITIEGDDVIISGYTRSGGLKGHAGDLQFKSYGNSGGKAWVAKIPVSKMESNTAFTTSDLTWAKDFDDYDNAKAGYVVKKNGNIAVLLWAENGKQNGKSCGLRMLDQNGKTLWTEKYGHTSKLEGTDLAISNDGNMVGITGHGGFLTLPSGFTVDAGYSGKIVTVDISPNKKGSRVLKTTEISGGGDPELIYNECWGIQAAPGWQGGFVVSCGTGIETCSTTRSSPAKDAQCKSGIGDKVNFPNLVAHAGSWMSMAAKVDSNNDLKWQRVDTYKGANMKAYVPGKPYTTPSSSASEFVVVNDDGSFSFLQDETFGFGVLKLKKEVLPPPPPPPPPTAPAPSTTGVDGADGANDANGANGGEAEGGEGGGPPPCAATCTKHPTTCTELNAMTRDGGCAATCKPDVTAELRTSLCVEQGMLRKN